MARLLRSSPHRSTARRRALLEAEQQTLHFEALIEDPGAYTKPFRVAWDIAWRANAELSEYICQENNKYLQRLTDDFGQPVFGK